MEEQTSGSENYVRYIPDEIWPEILSTLPVKYLLRFRSVSPSWRTLIDSPEFARLHLIRFPPTHTHIFLAEQDEEEEEERDPDEETRFVIRCSKTLQLTATPDLPFDDPIAVRHWKVLSSIDGLFMLHIYEFVQPSYYMLWNPSIRRSRKLPSPPQISGLQRIKGFIEFGFGFDPSLKDYKYVRLGLNYLHQALSVQVFTVGTNCWRNIGVEGCSCFVLKGELKSFCRRGVLYTLASDKKSGPLAMVWFDLRSEVFASTSLPVENHNEHSMIAFTKFLTMMNGEDSLVFVDMLGGNKCIVWVTENLGAEFQSLIWTQRYIFSPKISSDHFSCLIIGGGSFLHLNKNGEILENCNGMVTSYNLETGEKKILLENVSLCGNNSTWPFIESLVLY